MAQRITDNDIKLLIEEIALSGAVSLADASPSTYRNTARRINENLKGNKFEWRVKADAKNQLIEPYHLPGGLTASQKHEFAEKLIDWMCGKEYFYEVNIYTDTHRYTDVSEYKDGKGFERRKTAKGHEYIRQPYVGCPCEYHNKDALTITFEGLLFHAFNYDAWEATNDALDKIAKPYGLYNEQGYAWSTSFYPHCG